MAELLILSTTSRTPRVALAIYSSLLLGALAGAIIGLLYSWLGVFVFAALAGIINWYSKTALQFQVASLASSIFLVMTYLPWTRERVMYLIIGGVIIQISAVAQRYAARHFLQQVGYTLPNRLLHEHISAIILPAAILLSWGIAYIMTENTTLTHMFWAPLATAMIYRGGLGATWEITLKRIWISILVAIVAVASYGMLIQYGLAISTTVLFFNAWATMGQTPGSTFSQLLLELFIIGFCLIQLGGSPTIAYERIIFTLIGGGTALGAALLSSGICKRREGRT